MTTHTLKSKRGYLTVVIDNQLSICLKEGVYMFYDNATTGEDADFDATPFIAAYEAHLKEEAAKKEAKRLEAENKERERIEHLEGLIITCETPSDLMNEFHWELVETARHWSDLYEGSSHYAVNINSLEDYEVMKMAVEMHGIEGEWGETRHRAGEHHSEFSRCYDLADYQAGVKMHFQGDGFFYRSQEEDQENTLQLIKDAAEEGDMDEVRALISAFDELEPGYYDCNGNLEMEESVLESPSLTGYSYDVYQYSFAFQFAFKKRFQAEEEEEEEEDSTI